LYEGFQNNEVTNFQNRSSFNIIILQISGKQS